MPAIATRLTPQLVAEYTAKGYWQDLVAGERLDLMVAAHPQKVALVDARRRLTYAELGDTVGRLALGLHGLGLKKGDRLTAQLPNRAEAVALYFAVSKIGAVICPVVPYYRAAEVRSILQRSDSVAIVLPDTFAGFDYLSMLEEVRPSCPALRHIIVVGERVPSGMVSFQELVAGPGLSVSPAQRAVNLAALRPSPNDPLALMFTSGTEAAPKAPIWTHNTIHNSLCTNSSWQFTESDVVAMLSPIYHTFGLAVGVQVLLAEIGATVLWMDAFDPEETMRLVQRERATALGAVPPQIMAILNQAHFREYDLSSLRVVVSGAAPMPGEGIRRLVAEVGCGFVNAWGSTEAPGGLATRIDDPPELAATTVGQVTDPSIGVAVFGEDRQRPLPPGQAGELAIRGPLVFVGYYGDPELTRRSFHPEGWFFTGDGASMDERGYVTFLNRIKDVINRGGEKISPREVEEHLYAHPKVLAVAVVAMPDPRLGERSCAYVVPRPGESLSLEETVSFLLHRGIAKFKLPERLELVPSLPLTASGKIRKNVLREDIARKLREEEGVALPGPEGP